MKVYVLTEGEYSDYHIIGVTLDKGTADKFAELHESCGCNIEEYETDFIQFHAERKTYYVRYRTTPIIILGHELGNPRAWEELPDVTTVYGNIRKTIQNGTTWYTAYIAADSEEQAIKIFTDKLAEYRAKEAGI